MHADEISDSGCFRFCADKGLDVFGIVNLKECRCGASVLNNAVWRDAVRPGLLPSRKWIGAQTSTNCPMMVFRYKGLYVNGGLPSVFTVPSEDEIEYVWKVAKGQDAPANGGAVNPLGSSSTLPDGTNGSDISTPDGNRIWNQRDRSANASRDDVRTFDEYVTIPYIYGSGMENDNEKQVFEAALAAFAGTCIRFVKYEDIYSAKTARPFLEVKNTDPNKCDADFVGMPLCGYSDEAGVKEDIGCKSTLNIGWCHTQLLIGNIIRGLGHVIGMYDEQQRADAVGVYPSDNVDSVDQHGPFLKVNWNNLGPSGATLSGDAKKVAQSRFAPAADAYVASSDAWTNYDFESIMHHGSGAGKFFDTIPSADGVLVGNRASFSKGDIKQINDMYQCVLVNRIEAVAPTMAATLAPTDAPTDAPTVAPTDSPTDVE